MGKKVLVVALVIFSLSSCGLVYMLFGPPDTFIQWEDAGNGFIKFETFNEDVKGSLIFSVEPGSAAADLTYVETQVAKDTGAAAVPFGTVFCYQDPNNFYLLLIDVQGSYGLVKRVGGSFVTLIPPTSSSYLVTGVEAVNTLRVSDEGSNEIAISLNGTKVNSVIDSSFSSGATGFALVVGNGESFPDVPVSVRFKLVYPAAAKSLEDLNANTTAVTPAGWKE